MARDFLTLRADSLPTSTLTSSAAGPEGAAGVSAGGVVTVGVCTTGWVIGVSVPASAHGVTVKSLPFVTSLGAESAVLLSDAPPDGPTGIGIGPVPSMKLASAYGDFIVLPSRLRAVG